MRLTGREPGQQRRLELLSLRHRVGLLYEGRRRTVLDEPVDAMRRAGLTPVVDPRCRHARSQLAPGATIEVGFASSFRIFGALIDTLWTGRHQGISRPQALVGYRFGRSGRFIPKGRSDNARKWAGTLNSDPVLRQLLARAELKDLHLEEGPLGRTVQIQPLPGTITALYFPPAPALHRPDPPRRSRRPAGTPDTSTHASVGGPIRAGGEGPPSRPASAKTARPREGAEARPRGGDAASLRSAG